jgi:protein-S-isoprenylcysteine O-methyltransferase Ste14
MSFTTRWLIAFVIIFVLAGAVGVLWATRTAPSSEPGVKVGSGRALPSTRAAAVIL